MEVIKIYPQGYCKGVVKALQTVYEAVANKDTPRPIYILGKIIHNKYVVNELKLLNVITIDTIGKSRLELLDEISHGTVIFSAHGVSDDVYQKALAKNLNIIDASCEDVLSIHNSIKNYLSHNYDIIYIGTKGHPESEGVIGLSSKIHLVSSIKDIDDLKISNSFIYVSNQTTLSYYDINALYMRIRSTYPSALIENNICKATTMRQEALIKQPMVDLCMIIGDKESSNAKKLVYVSEQYSKTKTILVESLKEVEALDLSNINKISISSGASTPKEITNSIFEYLKNK